METQEKIEKVDIIEDKVDIVEKNQHNAEINALTLIDKAIEKDIDVDKFAKLVDIVKMLEKERAKRDFYEAFSKFQSSIPTIFKNSEVNMGAGRPHYNYASLSDIILNIQKPLGEANLSFRWEISNNNDIIEVTCILSHKGGYELQTSIAAPRDSSPGKSTVQAIASTITYLKRYTLISLLGIGTADPDDDAVSTIVEDKKNVIENKDNIIANIKRELYNCKDEDGIKKIWSKYQKYSNDAEILNLFQDWRKKQKELKKDVEQNLENKNNNNKKEVENGTLSL